MPEPVGATDPALIEDQLTLAVAPDLERVEGRAALDLPLGVGRTVQKEDLGTMVEQGDELASDQAAAALDTLAELVLRRFRDRIGVEELLDPGAALRALELADLGALLPIDQEGRAIEEELHLLLGPEGGVVLGLLGRSRDRGQSPERRQRQQQAERQLRRDRGRAPWVLSPSALHRPRLTACKSIASGFHCHIVALDDDCQAPQRAHSHLGGR